MVKDRLCKDYMCYVGKNKCKYQLLLYGGSEF